MNPPISYPSFADIIVRSQTQAYEKGLIGRRLIAKGHPKEALVYLYDALSTRKRHRTKSPFSSDRDICDAHYNVGTTIMEIVHQNTYEWNEVRAKDRADSANHLLKAFKILKDLDGEDGPQVNKI